jgi:hypothetical protein
MKHSNYFESARDHFLIWKTNHEIVFSLSLDGSGYIGGLSCYVYAGQISPTIKDHGGKIINNPLKPVGWLNWQMIIVKKRGNENLLHSPKWRRPTLPSRWMRTGNKRHTMSM